MVDFLTPAERSERMSRIQSKDTKPELLLRRALHALGFRFRLRDKKLPGKPDIVLPRYRMIIFVHGCFWHRHEGCRAANSPKSNVDFWQDKFARNVDRDRRVTSEAEALGWSVHVVWECEVNTSKKAAHTADALSQVITKRISPATRARDEGEIPVPSVTTSVVLDLSRSPARIAK